ncbi:hypothetical protein PR202_gb05406 [Eleusine coracana subsp. coracana]|uniref:Protein kinase domain-containing protein n=1 Tax=Eleusine coracana subsp. coracana TaxID=191504 RepID=A0AAV5E752_ELECO|nr:hypothetical protein PR202_gb05406 [Eleusine coracana subsp. coracana]
MRHPSASGGGGDAGFVRADQIDLKSLDEQLGRHLGRPAEQGGIAAAVAQVPGAGTGSRRGESARLGAEGVQTPLQRCREDWEIDPTKLIIKGVIARGTFGTVHRGVYDGQDVAVKMLDWGEDGHRSEQEIAALRLAFAQEVAVWHKLDHPNVTKFIGAIMGARDLNVQTENGHLGMPSNICCVVVEYLPGGALKNFLIKNRRRKLAFKVVVQIALDQPGGKQLIVASLHWHMHDRFSMAMLTTGSVMFTASEYACGEIYCCDMPYPDLSFSEVTSAVVRQNLRPEIPRCCPSSLANVMKRCWDANPDKRPEMAEVVTMLEAIDTSKGGGMIPKDQTEGCFSCFRQHRGP